MKTVQWLHETARRGCWRCGDATYNFQDCDKKESESYLFCYKCGEIGFKMGNCPYFLNS